MFGMWRRNERSTPRDAWGRLRHQPRPVKAKCHGQLLNAHIVYDLVIGTLGEGGVDRHKGTVALRGEARREGDGVLFADAHVREAGGKT